MNRGLSRIEMELGALSGSLYSRSVWDDLRDELRERGERIVERRRNAHIDGEDVGLLCGDG